MSVDPGQNLLLERKIMTRDGIFDDFTDLTEHNNNWTDNTNNDSGPQTIGPFAFTYSNNTGGAPASHHRRVRYLNKTYLAPTLGLPNPYYVNLVIESQVILYDPIGGFNDLWFGGFALSHADLDFDVANNKLWVGLWSTASDGGVRIFPGSLTATDYSSSPVVARHTFYQLTIQMIYDFLDDPTTIHIFAWIDGTLVVDDHTLQRSVLSDGRLDGRLGLAVDTEPDDGTSFQYNFVSVNRLDHPLSVQYRKSTLNSVPELVTELMDFKSETLRQLHKDTKLRVHVRSEISPIPPPYVNYKVRTPKNLLADTRFSTNLDIYYDFDGNLKSGSGMTNATYYDSFTNGQLAEVTTQGNFLIYGERKYLKTGGKVTRESGSVANLVNGTNTVTRSSGNWDASIVPGDTFFNTSTGDRWAIIARTDSTLYVDHTWSAGASGVIYNVKQLRHVSLPDINITWSGGFSIAFFIRNLGNENNDRIFAFGTTLGSANDLIEAYRDAATSSIRVRWTSGAGANLANFTIDNALSSVWKHIMITVTGNNLVLAYVDGEMTTFYTSATGLPGTVNRDESHIARGVATDLWDNTAGTGFVLELRNLMIWSKFLTGEEVGNLYRLLRLSVSELSRGLICKMDLNGDILDESEHFSPAQTGGAFVDLYNSRNIFEATGTPQYINVGDLNPLLSTGFTWAIWFRVEGETQANSHVVFRQYQTQSSNNNDIVLERDGTTAELRFEIRDGAGALLGNINNSSFANDILHHVIITLDPDTSVGIRMYKNGVYLATDNLSALPNQVSRSLYLAAGLDSPLGYSNFIGDMMNFRMWNRVLTDGEILRVAKEGLLQNRWEGYIYDIVKDDERNYGVSECHAYHSSIVLDKKVFTGSFTARNASYIIGDSTNGIIPLKAPDYDGVTNVEDGQYSLNKEYYQESLRSILLRLSADEDYLVWANEDEEIYFKPVGADDSGKEYVDGEEELIDYKIQKILPEEFTVVEVHSTQIWNVNYANSSQNREGGDRTLVVVNPSVTTQAEADRVANEALNNTIPFTIADLKVVADYYLEIGDVVSVTILDEGLDNRKFVLVEILENPDEDTQVLTLAENIASLADYFYSLDRQSRITDRRDMDKDSTVTYTIGVDINIVVWCEVLIEWSDDGATWETWSEGEAVVTPRAIAVVTGAMANRVIGGSTTYEADIANIDHAIGTGYTKAKDTDTELDAPLAASDWDSDASPTLVTTDLPYGQTINTWDNTEANDYLLSECGLQMKETTLGNTTFKHATDATFAPYNDSDMLMCRYVFTPFYKTSSNYLRIRYRWRSDTVIKERLSEK